MPQDRTTGAAGDAFGRQTAREIAAILGATMISSKSNECILNGDRVVIKCGGLHASSLGVEHSMLDRINFVIGALQVAPERYEVYILSADIFRQNMKPTRSTGRSAGRVSLVSRKVFREMGNLMQVIQL